MNFSEKIKFICESEGLSLKELSEITGMPYESLKSYRQGRRKPNHEKLIQLVSSPQISKYKDLILSDDKGTNDPTETTVKADPDEFISLWNEARALGVEADAIEILRVLLRRAKK